MKGHFTIGLLILMNIEEIFEIQPYSRENRISKLNIQLLTTFLFLWFPWDGKTNTEKTTNQRVLNVDIYPGEDLKFRKNTIFTNWYSSEEITSLKWFYNNQILSKTFLYKLIQMLYYINNARTHLPGLRNSSIDFPKRHKFMNKKWHILTSFILIRNM